MNSFGVIVVVLVGILVLLTLIKLGISIASTRRMTGQRDWSADGTAIGGIEPRGIDHRHNIGGHHNAGHHNAGHHNIGGHNMGGGGHVGGGGHHG